MANVYTVHFKIGGEPSKARFEYESHAVALAESLDGMVLTDDVVVTDMKSNEVWP